MTHSEKSNQNTNPSPESFGSLILIDKTTMRFNLIMREALDEHRIFLKDQTLGRRLDFGRLTPPVISTLRGGGELDLSLARISQDNEHKSFLDHAFLLIDLTNRDFSGYKFESATLNNVDMRGSILRSASFKSAYINGLKLTVTPDLLTVDFSDLTALSANTIEFYDKNGNRVYNISIDKETGKIKQIPAAEGDNTINWDELYSGNAHNDQSNISNSKEYEVTEDLMLQDFSNLTNSEKQSAKFYILNNGKKEYVSFLKINPDLNIIVPNPPINTPLLKNETFNNLLIKAWQKNPEAEIFKYYYLKVTPETINQIVPFLETTLRPYRQFFDEDNKLLLGLTTQGYHQNKRIVGRDLTIQEAELLKQEMLIPQEERTFKWADYALWHNQSQLDTKNLINPNLYLQRKQKAIDKALQGQDPENQGRKAQPSVLQPRP